MSTEHQCKHGGKHAHGHGEHHSHDCTLPPRVPEGTQEHPSVSLFREFLRIRTVHPTPDYACCQQFLQRIAGELGLPYSTYEPVKGKPVTIITWEGEDPSLPTLVLNSHVDVVPVSAAHWVEDPFAAVKLENGDIYARGTQDMKSVCIQYIEAIRRLRAAGKKFLRTIHLTFVPDEEIGGHDGMEIMVNSEDFRRLNPGLVLDEGLANPTNAFTLFYGERAPWWIRVTATGPPGHGSRFIEKPAMEKLMSVIEKFLAYRKEQKSILEGHESYRLGDVTTVNLTMLSGGQQFNIVPAEATAGFDIRIAPTEDLDAFKLRLDEWIHSEEGMSWEFVQQFWNNRATDLSDKNPWWTVFKQTTDSLGLTIETEIFPAATDSRYIRQKGINAFGFSPINNTPILLHDHNERLNEKVFLRGIEIYESLLPALANLSPDA